MVLLVGLEPTRYYYQRILLTPTIFIAYYQVVCGLEHLITISFDLGDSSMFSTHLELFVLLVLDCRIDFST